MSSEEWSAVVLSVAVAIGLLSLARVGLRGGELSKQQACDVVCPRLHKVIQCRIVRNIRTGQWGEVERCSAFRPSDAVLCDRECVRRMNLGVLASR